MQRMTARQYRQMRKRRNRSKYGNRKVEIDGLTFDSKAEALYYSELKLRQRAGEIQSFKLQPRYRLLEGFTDKHGKKHRPIDYVADFEILHNDNTFEVVDVKGMQTQVFRIKEKLFCNKYPYKLTLVKWEKGRFVEV